MIFELKNTKSIKLSLPLQNTKNGLVTIAVSECGLTDTAAAPPWVFRSSGGGSSAYSVTYIFGLRSAEGERLIVKR